MLKKSIILVISILIFLSSCKSSEVGVKSDVQDENINEDQLIAAIYDFYSGKYQTPLGWTAESIADVIVTGKGTILPFEEMAGIEELYCVNVKIDKSLKYDDEGILWFSFIVTRTGNYWEVEHAYYDSEWLEHSCPGEYLTY